MTEPTIPNGDHIPSFTTAAYLRQPTPSWDDLVDAWDKAEQFTMRRRPLPDQIRYIARQIMATANQHNDARLHALYVSLSLTATEAEKQLTGPLAATELRDAIADALTLCLKATAPIPSSRFPGTIGHYGGVTPHELADVALDVIRPYLPAPIEQNAQRQKEAAAAGARGEEIQQLSCGHTLSLQCANCSSVERDLRVELHMAYEQLVAAITHDRQPYPTAWSYEQACKAREKHRERADAAEQARRKAEAVTEVWRANTELAVGQRDQARAAIARVRAQCAEWARPIKSGSWDAQIRDDIAASCAEMILRALDGADQPADATGPNSRPARCTCASTVQALLGHHRGCPCHMHGQSAEVDQSGPTAADIVQNAPEQPVSGPAPVDEPAADACQVVHVDGGPVRIHGQGQMDETSAGYLSEIVAAAKRKFLTDQTPEQRARRRQLWETTNHPDDQEPAE